MTQKLTPFIGARFIMPSLGIYLMAVSQHDKDFVYVDLNDKAIDAVEGNARTHVLGRVIPTKDLEDYGFHIVLPVEPLVGDIISTTKSSPGHSFVAGEFEDLINDTAIIDDGGASFATRYEDIVVIKASADRSDLKYGTGDLVTVISGDLQLLTGTTATVLSGSGPIVNVQTDDGAAFSLHRRHIAPHLGWAFGVEYLGDAKEEDTTVKARDFLANSLEKMQGKFGADFTPANFETGGDNPLGFCFSAEELALLADLTEFKPSAACDLLGHAILQGRRVADDTLRAILNDEIPYGFAQFIPDATEFFKEIGRIVASQSEEKTRRMFEWIGLGAPADKMPDLEFEDAANIAFIRLTGINPNDGIPPVQPQEDVEADPFASFLDELLSGGLVERAPRATSILKGEGTADEANYVADFAEARWAEGRPTGVVTDPKLIEIASRTGYTPEAGDLHYEVTDNGDHFNIKMFAKTTIEIDEDGVPAGLADVIKAIFGADAQIVEIDENGSVTIEAGQDASINDVEPEDLAAREAVEGASTPTGDYLGLVDDTLSEMSDLAHIAKADTKYVAETMLNELTEVTRRINNIVNVIEVCALPMSPASWFSIRDAIVADLKGEVLPALDHVGNVAMLTQDLKSLYDGFDAIESDADNLLSLKP